MNTVSPYIIYDTFFLFIFPIDPLYQKLLSTFFIIAVKKTNYWFVCFVFNFVRYQQLKPIVVREVVNINICNSNRYIELNDKSRMVLSVVRPHEKVQRVP